MNNEAESNSPFLTVQTHSPDETHEIGREIGRLVKPSTVIGLEGTLGSGKTKLTQGIVQAIVDSPEMVVVSPTYTSVSYTHLTLPTNREV